MDVDGSQGLRKTLEAEDSASATQRSTVASDDELNDDDYEVNDVEEQRADSHRMKRMLRDFENAISGIAKCVEVEEEKGDGADGELGCLFKKLQDIVRERDRRGDIEDEKFSPNLSDVHDSEKSGLWDCASHEPSCPGRTEHECIGARPLESTARDGNE